MLPWLIWDNVEGVPHVYVAFPTEAAARAERASLLRPYPEGHEWRARLEVRQGVLVKPGPPLGRPRGA